MELVCDDTIRIWHANFGIPASKNDRIIISQSELFNGIKKKL